MNAIKKAIPIVIGGLPVKGSTEIDSNFIGTCRAQDPEFILEQAISKGVNHIVQEDSLAFDNEIALSQLMIADVQTFLNYPISAIMDPGHASQVREDQLSAVRVKCSSRDERYEAVDRAVEVVRDKVGGSLFSDLKLIGVELLTNATIHGSEKDKGELGDSLIRPCFLSLGWDQERVIMMCRDFYGTLDSRTLLERIRRCAAFGIGLGMNSGEGGAGIGSYMIFDLSISIYIAVAQGQTIIGVALPMRGSTRNRKAMSKNLHLHSA